jgi:SAM-dependent methyltransferase
MMNPAEFANIARVEKHFWWYEGMERILFRILDPIARERRFGRVLEAGCGTGHMALVLQQRYAWQVFPIDLQAEGLAYGRTMGLQRSAQADIAALPFAAGAFDAALSLDVIVHFPRGEEHRAIRELARVLAPGGMLALRVAAFDILRSRHSQFTLERQRFTRKRLIHLACAHGIRVLRCTYANSLLLPVALVKFRVVEPLARKKPESGVRPVARSLNRLLSGLLSVEAYAIGGGWDFPIGQSLVLIGEKLG